MKLGILGAGVFHPADLSKFSVPPAWRKATRNMIMAVKSMELALLKAPMLMEGDRSGLGLVLGTNSGELETTADFVTTLARSGMARPLLFQNSLHNATTGFASIHFGVTGPAFTLSDRERTPTEALSLAEMLIREGTCSAVIVTLVEVHKLMADYLRITVPEGACTLVVASEEIAATMRAPFSPLDPAAREFYETDPALLPLFDVTRSEFYRTAVRLGGVAP